MTCQIELNQELKQMRQETHFMGVADGTLPHETLRKKYLWRAFSPAFLKGPPAPESSGCLLGMLTWAVSQDADSVHPRWGPGI